MRLTFPILEASGKVNHASQPLQRPTTGLRILLVDDDRGLLDALRDTLEADGHDVMTAGGGQEGIDAFRAAARSGTRFAVVITDLGMPYVDGRRVAAAIKGASPATPVILLTGWGHRLTAEGTIPEHVDRVLSKPPRIAELRIALKELAGALAQSP